MGKLIILSSGLPAGFPMHTSSPTAPCWPFLQGFGAKPLKDVPVCGNAELPSGADWLRTLGLECP